MNTIARALFIIGWITIASGIILAFTNFQVVVGYEEPLTSFSEPEPIVEESFTVFISYIVAGLVVGIMMLGFGEIVNLLDRIHRSINGNPGTDSETKNKKGEVSKYNQFIQDSINN